MAEEKEPALIIIFQVSSTGRAPKDLRAAGVPHYNCIKYAKGSIPGCVITKGYYNLRTLDKNIIHLTNNDRKIVRKYRANDNKKEYKAYLISGRHWLRKKDMIHSDDIVRGRVYFEPSDSFIIQLKKKIHIIYKKYEKQYDLYYVKVSIQLPHLLNLMNGTKNFEYRKKFRYINNEYESSVKEQMEGIIAKRDNFMKQRYVITSNKPQILQAAVVSKYMYDSQKSVQSLIRQKAALNSSYNALLDGEILFILSHLRQYEVTNDDILGAKPLILSVRKYVDRKFYHDLHRKSIHYLRVEYNPGSADQSS